MHYKAIADQDTSFPVSSFPSFGIKDMLEPLEANHRVGIPRLGVRILLPRGWKRGPVALIGTRRADYHRV